MSEIIQGILPKSDAVDILVGYFFFSGYYLLSQGLANKKLRILVGLDVDTNISKSIQIINTLSANKLSLGQLRENIISNSFIYLIIQIFLTVTKNRNRLRYFITR